MFRFDYRDDWWFLDRCDTVETATAKHKVSKALGLALVARHRAFVCMIPAKSRAFAVLFGRSDCGGGKRVHPTRRIAPVDLLGRVETREVFFDHGITVAL